MLEDYFLNNKSPQCTVPHWVFLKTDIYPTKDIIIPAPSPNSYFPILKSQESRVNRYGTTLGTQSSYESHENRPGTGGYSRIPFRGRLQAGGIGTDGQFYDEYWQQRDSQIPNAGKSERRSGVQFQQGARGQGGRSGEPSPTNGNWEYQDQLQFMQSPEVGAGKSYKKYQKSKKPPARGQKFKSPTLRGSKLRKAAHQSLGNSNEFEESLLSHSHSTTHQTPKPDSANQSQLSSPYNNKFNLQQVQSNLDQIKGILQNHSIDHQDMKHGLDQLQYTQRSPISNEQLDDILERLDATQYGISKLQSQLTKKQKLHPSKSAKALKLNLCPKCSRAANKKTVPRSRFPAGPVTDVPGYCYICHKRHGHEWAAPDKIKNRVQIFQALLHNQMVATNSPQLAYGSQHAPYNKPNTRTPPPN